MWWKTVIIFILGLSLFSCGQLQQQLDASLALESSATEAHVRDSAAISAEIAHALAQIEPLGLGVASSLAYSPDGSRIAVGSSDGLIIYSSDILKEMARPSQFGWYIDVAYSPDGAYLAAVERHLGELHIWNSADWAHLHTIDLGETNGISVAYSPDGKRIATGDNTTFHLWDTTDFSKPLKSESFNGSIDAVAFSPNHRFVAAGVTPYGGGSPFIKVWDRSDWSIAWETDEIGNLSWLTDLSFSPNSAYLLSAANHWTIIRDASSGALIDSFEHAATVRQAAFSPNGDYLAAVTDTAQIALRSGIDGTWITDLHGYAHPLQSIAFAPDGAQMIVGHRDGALRVWDVANETVLHTVHSQIGVINDMAIAPDGSQLAIGETAGRITLWEMPNKQLSRNFNHGAQVNSVAYSADGTLLASAGDDGLIKLWNSADGTLQQALDHGTEGVDTVAFSPDGSWVVSGGGDDHVNVWNIESGLLLFQFHQTAWVTSVAVSADNQLLASGDYHGYLRVWRIADGAEAYTIDAHNGAIYSLDFSADHQLLASGSEDKTIKLWQAATGSEQTHIDAHWGAVQTITFSADSRLLASASSDGSLGVWDTADGALHTRLWGQWAPEAVVFTPDQTQLISGARDAMVRFWAVDNDLIE